MTVRQCVYRGTVCAGFTTKEAKEMFDKVDVDGGGSVSLEEFEKWWIVTQRQEVGSG